MPDSKCKFCQTPEGAPGGRHGVIHINRDNLCGPCATLLDKIKYQPEKIDEKTRKQFVANCEWNFTHGLFVPVEQRRELRQKQVWTCRRCGRTELTSPGLPRDKQYTTCCEACADEIRSTRIANRPHHYKTRRDKRSYDGVWTPAHTH